MMRLVDLRLDFMNRPRSANTCASAATEITAAIARRATDWEACSLHGFTNRITMLVLNGSCFRGRSVADAEGVCGSDAELRSNCQTLAAEHRIEAGLAVRSGWESQQYGFADEQFLAFAAIAVFRRGLDPSTDRIADPRSPEPGWVLAMILMSKHAVTKAVDSLMKFVSTGLGDFAFAIEVASRRDSRDDSPRAREGGPGRQSEPAAV